MSEDDQREARRARRRQGLPFGRVPSFAALARAGLEFWRTASLGEKFQATLGLVRASWILEGHDGPVPRLDRSVGGVRQLRS